MGLPSINSPRLSTNTRDNEFHLKATLLKKNILSRCVLLMAAKMCCHGHSKAVVPIKEHKFQ